MAFQASATLEAPMLNFSRNDRPADPAKDARLNQRPAAPANVGAPAPRVPALPEAAAPGAAPAPAAGGSRLAIGPGIDLKGAVISNCDVLAIEGNVEATVSSKVMEIAPPGRLNGTATIDVAEVHGEFSGELTARERLVVHGTGRVTGTIRYGKLVVAHGGTINGDLTQLEAATRPAASAAALRIPLAPQPG
jgi:cytoskeletal protein CcmA (bactofilin family)